MGKFLNNIRLTDRVEIYLIVNDVTYEKWVGQIWKYMEWNSNQIEEWKKEISLIDKFNTLKDSIKINDEYQIWLENKFSNKLNQYADQYNTNRI